MTERDSASHETAGAKNAARAAPAQPVRNLPWSWRRAPARTVVDVHDPLGGAINDAEVLLAFAAQSRHALKAATITDLTSAIETLSTQQQQGQQPSATDRGNFWVAYDALANEMAPLSAQSVRASMEFNHIGFPRSMFTVTSVNAALAILVFFICIMLQGFWSAGREMLDKAELLETQKAELMQRLQRNEAQFERRKDQLARLSWQLCPPDGFCADDFPETNPVLPPDMKPAEARPARTQAATKEEMAKLRAEKQLAVQELREKMAIVGEQRDELRVLNNRSRAVEDVMASWHKRATAMCTRVGALCPIEVTGDESKRSASLRGEVEALRNAISAREAAANSTASDLPAAERTSAERQAQHDLRALVAEKERRDAALAVAEADESRGTLHRVRLTLVNISSNFLPMFMGLLGALAYILRSLTIQLRDHTYVPVSLSLSVVRMCLGAVAGVFGTMMAPGSEGALKSLPPLIVPFVFGYGIEILFSLMDRVVNSFTQPESARAADKA